MSSKGMALGIDVGGSGIKGAPVDLKKGEFAAIANAHRNPQPATPEAVCKVIAQIVDHFDEVRGDSPIGVTIPGVVTDGVVRVRRQHRQVVDRLRRQDAPGEGAGPHRPRRQRRRCGRGRRGPLRRCRAQARPGHPHHPRDRDRHRPPAGRQAHPELRARAPRDRRPGRRDRRGLLDQGQGGPLVCRLGPAAAALLQPPGGVALAGPVRRGRWRLQGRRPVPPAAEDPHAHHPGEAAQQGRHHRRGPPRQGGAPRRVTPAVTPRTSWGPRRRGLAPRSRPARGCGRARGRWRGPRHWPPRRGSGPRPARRAA